MNDTRAHSSPSHYHDNQNTRRRNIYIHIYIYVRSDPRNWDDQNGIEELHISFLKPRVFLKAFHDEVKQEIKIIRVRAILLRNQITALLFGGLLKYVVCRLPFWALHNEDKNFSFFAVRSIKLRVNKRRGHKRNYRWKVYVKRTLLCAMCLLFLRRETLGAIISLERWNEPKKMNGWFVLFFGKKFTGVSL